MVGGGRGGKEGLVHSGLVLGFWDLQRDLKFRKIKIWFVTLTFSCMWLHYM